MREADGNQGRPGGDAGQSPASEGETQRVLDAASGEPRTLAADERVPAAGREGDEDVEGGAGTPTGDGGQR